MKGQDDVAMSAVTGGSSLAPEFVATERGARSIPAYPAQIHVLTSLRYLAAAWVVFFHFKEYLPESQLSLSPFLVNGHLGVDFFFVLSGFVLGHAYLPKLEAGRFGYWDFVSKRVARIYPMHVFTLLFFVAFGIVAHKMGWSFRVWSPDAWFDMKARDVARALFANLTLIHAWGAVDGLMFNMPSWSISAEWFAYLLFPVSVLLLSVRRLPAWVGVVAAIVLFSVMYVAVRAAGMPGLLKMTATIGALRIFPEFMLGIAIYRLGRVWSAGPKGALILFWVSVLGTIGTALADLPGALIVLGLACVIFFGADAERAGHLRWLANPFAVLLGEISYSVYMVHFAVGMIVFELLFPAWRTDSPAIALLAIAGALALATAISYLTYRLIELPGRSLVISGANGLNRLSTNEGHRLP